MAPQQQQQQQQDDVVAYEDNTPTPAGWKRKLISRIGKGTVATQTHVVFISPSGEEFKSRAQLQRHLKASKGGPSPSEFIWVLDETPLKSTRSKSLPLVKPLETSSRVQAKRKSGTDVKEIGSGKRKNSGKMQKPVKDSKIVEGDDAKNPDVPTVIEEENKATEITPPAPTSSRKKRSENGAVSKDSSLPVAKSSSTPGAADASKKEEKAVETVNDSSSKKHSSSKTAGKGNQTKGRSAGKKGAALRGKRAANVDVSNAGECGDGSAGGEGDHPEETASMEHNDETLE